MADEEKNGQGGGDEAKLDPQERLTKMLESRWDPGKMSKLMRGSEQSRAQRLDSHHRGRFEKRLGVDLGDVRIFSGELAEEITHAHNAEALTVGDTGMILMRNRAAFTPGSASGTALLAHELTHVAQSRPSMVSRKAVETDLAEEDESEEEAEEHEAEVLAEEMGVSPGQMESEGDKGEKERDKKEQIKEKVLELMDQDDWDFYTRLGITRDYDWRR